MTNVPSWLPFLMKLDEYSGDWPRYIDAIYSVFYRDFIQTHPMFRSRHVTCRRDPICDGKEAGFWHCTSTGADESNRTPDLRRCERIGWVRALIEHEKDTSVDVWIRDSGRKGKSIQIWFNEEYLVVLGIRKNCYLLVTGYCTDRNHTIWKMQKERDCYIKKLTSPEDDVDTPSTHGR